MIDEPPIRRRELDETFDEIAETKGYRSPWPTLVWLVAIFGLIGFLVWATGN